MKKRLIALLLTVCTLSMTSCSLFKSIRTYFSDLKNISDYKFYGYNSDNSENYEFDDEVVAVIDNRFDQLDEFLSSNDSLRTSAFIELYKQQLNDIYYLSDHANLAFVTFCKDPNNKEYSEQYQKMTKLLNDKSARLYRMYRLIHQSEYKDAFFAGWEDAEVEKALKMSDQYTEEFVKLSDKVDEYVQKYNQLDENDKSNYSGDSAKLYRNIVGENLLIAKEAGYDSYADYAYEYVYGRDFTPQDAEKFYGYIKDYIVPLGKDLLDDVRSCRFIDRVNAYVSDLRDKNCSSEEFTEKLTPYYDKLGDANKRAFESFKNNYVSVSDESARGVAFTFFLNYYRHPSCFFGPDYQNLMTYVHEQGHYLSMYKSGTPIQSVDLNETQSQGNEWLYLSYIGSDYDPSDYSFIVKTCLIYDILSIVLSTCCDAFEQYVYQHPDLTAEQYDRVFISIAKNLDAYDFLTSLMSVRPEEYWHRAIVSNSFYYLSYAVSMIPVLELYVISQEDGFDKAAAIYNKLTLVPDDDAMFVQSVTGSGLSNPFEESVFERIYNYFT